MADVEESGSNSRTDASSNDVVDPDVLELIQEGDCIGDVFELLVNWANGCLDFTLLLIVIELGDAVAASQTSQTPITGQSLLGILVIMLILSGWWVMGNFVLPFLKKFQKKKYYLMLGNKDWECEPCEGCIKGVCGQRRARHSFLHPRNCLFVNLMVSDIGGTIWAYYVAEDPLDPVFVGKAILAAIQGLYEIHTLCVELSTARKLYSLHSSGTP
mmetsp:Transcript_35717/g.86306  ORF Transcript_35717/g.86306 Transcript_35717/m.86306 type:complete len:215 (-) Transcript_35717:143-787(-)|eukprot:CAMPEP_0113470192 /NCGR_PEP_ID=MMETSP0014_2-20120614/16307_1 /TAXON_ID=2857 /ORGANISM="Nitzschia sp." /LENGTH=214 /DNA_ID=CAMNT_0000362731 /DNA_START=284 /DNA_END=928 /DNA_ORIENTATION=- /assembly_acc=CAM_ASM_000159